MSNTWAYAGPSILAAFLASLVEFVEALTVVLAVGSVRGWRSALAGSFFAVLILLVIVAVLGAALTRIPVDVVQLTVGTLLLLFGMRWLRKAILRSAGILPLHDEQAAYAKETDAMRRLGDAASGWDRIAFAATFQITMLEGTEVVFIVIAIGAGGTGLLVPASLGALAALLLVIALGLLIHRPLASVPENKLKFAVGVLLSSFGTFWAGEGMGVEWPGADWSLLGLVVGFLLIALLAVPASRARARSQVAGL
jgi:Ca2+/H+ antiporter, TMEM165/GDT1 family